MSTLQWNDLKSIWEALVTEMVYDDETVEQMIDRLSKYDYDNIYDDNTEYLKSKIDEIKKNGDNLILSRKKSEIQKYLEDMKDYKNTSNVSIQLKKIRCYGGKCYITHITSLEFMRYLKNKHDI